MREMVRMSVRIIVAGRCALIPLFVTRSLFPPKLIPGYNNSPAQHCNLVAPYSSWYWCHWVHPA